MPRPSALAGVVLGVAALAFAVSLLDAARLSDARQPARDERRALVDKLGLTDLALFTEARYTRHPSQADLHSALQDHPAAFDHFPTGALLAPPPHLTAPYASLAGKTASPD
ncbi:MAG: hypothetical protein H6R15_3153 [Proteobacteria bacterium]|nr:hypothetical protein [Pseudomonadota bacterium]